MGWKLNQNRGCTSTRVPLNDSRYSETMCRVCSVSPTDNGFTSTIGGQGERGEVSFSMRYVYFITSTVNVDIYKTYINIH